MHFPISLQTIFTIAFTVMIVAPLPVLLFSAPVNFVMDKVRQWKYQRLVGKHFEKPEQTTFEQLKNIFPMKKTNEIKQIMYYLQPENYVG